MQRFWMVIKHSAGKDVPWNERPAHKHFVQAEALKEAQRLSAKQPGDIFFVLEALCSVSLPFEIKPTQSVSQETIKPESIRKAPIAKAWVI